ncbi:MAG: 2-amino-4-hydroxy-6-hydroxymethyldihydropteridine diphosphokinase [Pseudomonadota bacterium]
MLGCVRVYALYGKFMTDSLLSFGTNQSLAEIDLRSTFDLAISKVTEMPDTTITRISRTYSTPAVPVDSGPDFLNAVALVKTAYQPKQLLAMLHGIEDKLGRIRPVRWGPRVCDIDLLAFGDLIAPNHEILQTWMALDDDTARATPPDQLLLPHPRMHRRGFVLLPLLEVAPDWTHPVLGQTVREMVDALPPEATRGICALDED